MMLITSGYASLAFALLSVLYGIFALSYGKIRKSKTWLDSGRQACLILFPLLSISLLSLLILLIRKDYSVEYVYETVNQSQPLYLQISAIWGKQSGSLLFWTWLFSGFLFIWVRKSISADDPLFPTASIILLANIGFFVVLNLFFEHPFNRFWQDLNTGKVYSALLQPSGSILFTPENGLGMNPLLRHFGMILHPPALYLGYVGVFIPGAVQISALIHKPEDTQWMQKTRPWFIFAWIFLAVGLILGSRWAYDVLGWGGYWGWDPVEVSALIPFLLLTAFVHAVMGNVYTQKFRRWTMVSGLLTSLSIVFSTFVTRSGMISSVHAFSESPLSGPLTGYLLVSSIFVIGLIITRWNSQKTEVSTTAPEHDQSILSRETVFTGMILLLFVISFFCLWGILIPNISALFSSTPISIGTSYYTTSTGPLFLLFIFLTGIFPLTRWGKTISVSDRKAFLILAILSVLGTAFIAAQNALTQPLRLAAIWAIMLSILIYLYDWIKKAFRSESGKQKFVFSRLVTQFTSNPRRFSISLLHSGILLMALGIIGIEFFQSEDQISFQKNNPQIFSGFTLTYLGMQETDSGDETISQAEFQVVDGANNSFSVFPEKKYYSSYRQQTTIPGIASDLSGDLYLILNEVDDDHATIHAYYNPLINWLWIGSAFLCLAGILIFIGSLKRKKVRNG